MQSNTASFMSQDREPSKDVVAFLDRIEHADPNAPDLSEDDDNTSWGHHQFTAGSLTCRTVLTSWDCIGNIAVACKLIAAAIKTCKVARHLCFSRNIKASNFLSDIYLSSIVELLWGSWKDAGGVSTMLFGQYFT
jgi:hypothetical protein